MLSKKLLPKNCFVEFSPEHWNNNCQATIPEAWQVIDADGFVHSFGETKWEAIKWFLCDLKNKRETFSGRC